MRLIAEFKEFALKGNMMDLAIGVIIGGAFGKIVTSLVADVITPLISLFTGGVNVNGLTVILRATSTNTAGETIPALTLNYGAFLQNIIDFTIVAAVIFMMIKGMNSLRREKPAAPPAPAAPEPPREELLLTEIRDLLKTRA